MVLECYDSIFVLKNDNILILYNYGYYCDFKNKIIVIYSFYSIYNVGFRIRYLCQNTDTVSGTPYIPLDKLYIIYEPII